MHNSLVVITRKLTRVRQGQVLEAFSATNGWQLETIQDLGSGLNYNKRGLQKLLKRIMQGDVSRLVLTHKDRLLRLGAELVFAICAEFETEVIIINTAYEYRETGFRATESVMMREL
jgi:predicted site-specific integrase-resolvase